MYYNVKVKITPSDPNSPNTQYKSTLFTGEFVSKGKQTKREKIEQQVKAFILKGLTAQESGITFDIKVTKIDRFDKKFIVVEDKE